MELDWLCGVPAVAAVAVGMLADDSRILSLGDGDVDPFQLRIRASASAILAKMSFAGVLILITIEVFFPIDIMASRGGLASASEM